MLQSIDSIRNALHAHPHSFDAIKEPIIRWSDINSLLSSGLLDYPRIRIISAGNEYSKAYSGFLRYSCSDRGERLSKIIPGALYKTMRMGGTIIIDRCEAFFPQARSLVSQISAELGCHAWANLYISPKGSSGFGCHFDDHDVLAIQLYGDKSWTIYDPTYQSPIRGAKSFHFPPPKGTPLRTEILTSGKGIYLPSGYWHNVETISNSSLHITIGMDFPRRSDILQLIYDELAGDSFFREPLTQEEDCEFKDKIVEATKKIDIKTLIKKKRDSTTTDTQSFNFPDWSN